MSVLPYEGTYPILYGAYGVPIGSGYQQGYLARPDQAGRFPAVVVVADCAGVTAHEKDVARRLARHGFAAVVIDACGGSDAAADPAADRQALRRIDESYEFIMSADISWALDKPVGLTGLGAGGRFAVGYGADYPAVGAVVMVGAPLDNSVAQESLARATCPVLGLYGADDPVNPLGASEPASPTASWVVYQGAGSGFLNDAAPGYDPAAAADAYERIFGFLATALPPAEVDNLG